MESSNPLGTALAVALGLAPDPALHTLGPFLLGALLGLLGLERGHPLQHALILFAALVIPRPGLVLLALGPVLPVVLEGVVELLSCPKTWSESTPEQ